MVKQRRTQSSFVFMILCLCLGSLLIMAMMHFLSPSMLEFPGHNSGAFNHVEFDETFLFVILVGLTATYLLFFKSNPINMDFKTANVTPRFPPPKK